MALVILPILPVMAGTPPASGQEDAKPGRPTNLTGTVAHDAVRLTWEAPQDSTVTGYQILRLQRGVAPGAYVRGGPLTQWQHLRKGVSNG